MAQKFTQIGIYDSGQVLIPSRPEEVFLDDVVQAFALIREIKGEPLGRSLMGITYYSNMAVDFTIGHITMPETWKIIVDNGLAGYMENEGGSVLRYVLKQKHPIPAEVFDILYGAYPGTYLEDILWECGTKEAAEWALAHGADRGYRGLKFPVVHYLLYSDKPEAEDIFQSVYGCSRENYKTGQKAAVL